MSDMQLSRMLLRAGDEPSQQFINSLRRDLLAGFEDSTASSSTSSDAVADVEFDRPHQSDDGLVPLEKPTPAPHRRRWPLLAAAAMLLIAGTVAVITRHRAPDKLSPSTTVPHSFSQKISVDVQMPAGAKVHIEGTVALPLAVESNESTAQPVHDVLLLPTLTATVTNKGGQPVTIAQAYVEIFLRGDRSACVVNLGGCETALITGQHEDGTSPTVLGPGEGLPLSDAGRSSRISVPAGEVTFTIDQVHDGSMVVGYAVVVEAGAGDDIASVVFDRSGHSVLTCASAPDDCLGPTRDVLGDDAVRDTSVSVPNTIPSSDLPPGTYTAGAFRVPITFTTTRKWNGVLDSSSTLTFRRTSRDPAVVDEQVVFVVLRPRPDRQTVDDIINTCTDSFDRSEPTQTTLDGRDAISVSGVLTADCIVIPDYSNAVVGAGNTMRITAADLGDGQFLAAVAVARTDLWAEFSDEVDAMFASVVPG